MKTITVSKVLLLIAVILEVLAALSVRLGTVDVGWLGMAFLAAGLLVP